jgi:hypothetical protein
MGIGPSAGTVNEWLDSTFVNPGAWLELHTGDPGTNGASNVADTTGRQLALFTRPSNGLVQTTGAVPQFTIPEEAADQTITHASVHTEMEGGTWRWNLVANSPIQLVGGDVVTIGDGVEFRIQGWTA